MYLDCSSIQTLRI